MIKSQTAAWALSLGGVATAGVVFTATEFLNTASTNVPATAGGGSITSAQPKKSAEAEPPSKSLTLTGSLNVTGLAPGVSIIRTLTIGNPNNQDVELQSVKTVLTGPSPAPTVGTCASPADFEVIVAGYNATTGAGSVVTIKKNASLDVPVTVRMNNSDTRNQDPCKGKSWTFAFLATATSK
ncbi:MAG: hypothetical protein JWP14_1739 [Frankiales bacterium]|nr:hypothetical protein [Frankiales bacterium]